MQMPHALHPRHIEVQTMKTTSKTAAANPNPPATTRSAKRSAEVAAILAEADARAVAIQNGLLLDEIREHWTLAQESFAQALEHAHEVGRRLKAIHATVVWGKKDGGWAGYVEQNCPFGVKWSYDLMLIADKWERVAAEREHQPGLSVRAARQLLAASEQDTPAGKRRGKKRKERRVLASREFGRQQVASVAKTVGISVPKLQEALRLLGAGIAEV